MKEKQVRVLHVAPGFLYGGIESRLIDWYKCMNHDLIHFDVVKVTSPEPNPLVDQLEDMGCKVFSIPPLGAHTAFSHFHELKNIIDKGHYDIIHSHSLSYGWYPFLYGRKKSIKVRILHSRTNQTDNTERNLLLKEVLSKLALSLATDYFACSEEAGLWAFGSKHEFHIVRNGIFLNDFMYNKERREEIRNKLNIADCFIIGTVCRFARSKNLEFALRVFAQIYNQNQNARMVLIGDGPMEADLKQLAISLNIKDAVLFLGRREDVGDLLNIFDLFIFPSFYEGFGTVAIEAQANGLPCIISTGVPRTVKVLDDVQFINPTDNDAWIAAIMNSVGKMRSSENNVRTSMASFDIRLTAQWLQDYYLSSISKEA